MFINGFFFYEDSSKPKSPITQFASENARAIVTLRSYFLTGTQVFQAVKALIGFNTTGLEGGVSYITRGLPAFYPAIIDPSVAPTVGLNPFGTPYLWATSIPEVEPEGNVTGLTMVGAGGFGPGLRPTYNVWHFKVEFNSLTYYVKSDAQVLGTTGPLTGFPNEGQALASGWSNSRYVTKIVEDATRTVTMRKGFLRFVGSVDPIPEGIPFTQFRSNITYIWHQIPIAAIPNIAIATCSGKVNNLIFDGYQPGTLLFTGYRFRPWQGPIGDRLVDIEYRFIYMPNFFITPATKAPTYAGWNSIPNVVAGMFVYTQFSADGTYDPIGNPGAIVFKPADLTTLFNPDQPF
jgi:hypothetical protein